MYDIVRIFAFRTNTFHQLTFLPTIRPIFSTQVVQYGVLTGVPYILIIGQVLTFMLRHISKHISDSNAAQLFTMGFISPSLPGQVLSHRRLERRYRYPHLLASRSGVCDVRTALRQSKTKDKTKTLRKMRTRPKLLASSFSASMKGTRMRYGGVHCLRTVMYVDIWLMSTFTPADLCTAETYT